MYLEQELESLKAVLEIKNEKLHQQDIKLMKMEKLVSIPWGLAGWGSISDFCSCNKLGLDRLICKNGSFLFKRKQELMMGHGHTAGKYS